MYNLCSERTYDTHHFIGCTVERFMIDDHNVPTLEDMLRFAKSVKGKITFSSKIFINKMFTWLTRILQNITRIWISLCFQRFHHN